MLHLSRYIGVAVLVCATAACGRVEKQAAPAPEQPATSVEQAAPPPVPPAPITPERTTRTTAPRPPAALVQKGPAPPVVVRGVLTNGDAAILSDFQRRLGSYVDLKKGVDKKTPDQKQTSDPIKIELTQKLLAAKIMNVRRNARQGDIFTPQISAKFRQLLVPEVAGTTGKETKKETEEDVEERDEVNPKVPMKVNIEYTEGAALPTTPANVLAALPKLPEGLEYRILGKNLILRDADANIIVDFIRNAVQ